MNLSYFRTSKFDYDQTIKNILENIKAQDLSGELEQAYLNGTAAIISVSKKEWIENLLKADHNLLGFLPTSIVVIKTSGKVLIGVTSPSLLAVLSQQDEILKISEESDRILKELIHKSAGVGPLKPSKVKLYSTKTCPYCVMEKEWLEQNKVDHEVVYLENDMNAAQRISQETGQMGVPVTEIIYEDDTPEFVIGFNKPQLTKVLGI